jgi:hypothetical protein
MDAERLIKRAAQLKSDRSQHEHIWRECFDFTWPLRSEGFNADVTNASGAHNKRAKLLVSDGTDAAGILAAGLMSGLTPSNSRWFELSVEESTDEERNWLSRSSEIIWRKVHNGNFDAEAFEGAMDSVGGGWFVLFADYATDDEDQPTGFKFEHWPMHECYIACSKRNGPADTLFREYTLTAEQAVSEFGEAAVSSKVREAFGKEPDKPFRFLHAIYPRTGAKRDAVLAKRLPFASVHVECDGKTIVRETGFHEQPVIVPRWARIPGSAYAVGRVFDALPDIKQLNELMFFENAAAETAIAPPLIAEDDGVLNPRTMKIGPRKVIVASSVDSVKPLVTGGDFNVSFTKKDELERKIRRTLMADQLQPQDGPAMTATEVHVRVGLIRQMLGPHYGRYQSEYLQVLVERCFGLAYRAGWLPPVPESLGDRPYTVQYMSPMARAQKLEDVSAMDRFENTLAAEAEFVPDVLDRYDFDKAVAKRAELLGVPADVIRTDRQVRALRDARVAQQKRDQAQASQATAAQALADEKPGVAAASLMQAQAANAEAAAA